MSDNQNTFRILREIDKLEYYHDNIRKLLPYMNEKMKNKISIEGEVNEVGNPFRFQYCFQRSIDNNTVAELNDFAHYLNQNVLIRLFSILHEFKVIKYKEAIKVEIPGGNKVNLLKKLRHVLSHESGKYFSNNRKHRAIAKLFIRELNIKFDLKKDQEFDLSKDTVIKPIFQGAREYVNNCP